MRITRGVLALTWTACIIPAWAGDAPPTDHATAHAQAQTEGRPSPGGSSNGSDIGFRGWGLRAGAADDIDQVLFGAHFNLGEFTRNLRFQPDVQLGVGDDHTTLFVTAPVYWRFENVNNVVPYVGGGPSAGWVDHDHGGGNGDDGDFEIGGKLTGGLEWPRAGGRALFVEVNLGFGDVHDAQAVVGWSF